MAAFIKSFEYDIFISYASVDDQPTLGEEKGWVKLFHEALEVQLSKRLGRIGVLKIWRGPRIEGEQLFDQTIKTAIDSSALFLALTSHGFLASDYCQQELRWFHDKAQRELHGLQIGDRSRIYNVLLNNIHHDRWPEEFGRAEFERISGHKFHDANRDDEFGEPSKPQSERFDQQMRKLVDSLYKMLLAFKEKVAPAAMGEAPNPNTAPAVYLADVADSLLVMRKRLVNDLQRKGVHILKQIPPPYDLQGHAAGVNAELEKARLSVHLLDGLPGREMNSATMTYPQQQAELGLNKSTPQLIWFPADLKLETIESEIHQAFLNRLENGPRSRKNYDLVRCAASELANEILQKLAQLQPALSSSSKSRAMLLDTHLKDQLFAFELGRYLAQNGVQPYILQETDAPQKTLTRYEELLNEVDTLVILFGQVAQEWVRERLATALQFVARQLVNRHQARLKACCVYLLPPRTPAEVPPPPVAMFNVHVLDNSRSEKVEPNAIAPLLREISE